MSAPKLVVAVPNGQSSVRAVFDQPMRELGPSAVEDPGNVALWSPGGGLPSISEVIRVSNVEFELILASPAPVAGGYTITVANTVQSGAGETIDPGFLSYTFAVTTADLVIAATNWVSDTEIEVVFSEAFTVVPFEQYNEVVQFLAIDAKAREPAVIAITQSGASFKVSLENPGTRGARYNVSLTRELFVADATNVTLLLGEEAQTVWGQGLAPSIASLAIAENSAEIVSSEVLGKYPSTEGWPLSHGLYKSDIGSLGPSVPLTEGSTPASLKAEGADFSGLTGATATWEIKKTVRALTAGSDWSVDATSALGAGNVTVGAGTTTLNKTSGAPYELVFSGGSDSLTKAGRQFSTTIDVTSFTPGATNFPYLAITWLNTQVSVLIEKTISDLAQIKIFLGNKDLGLVSEEFDPTTAFVLTIVDATNDSEGFFAVEVNGEVVIGAPSSDVLDQELIATNVGATAIAVTAGSPLATSEVFSLEMSTDIEAQTYLASGFLGYDSKDLFSFSGASSTAVVTVSSEPTSGGYAETGKAAFGAHAEYMPEVNAVQVVIGLNTAAQPAQFTGSVSLLTGNEQVMDQALIDEQYVLTGGEEIIVVFLNPKLWAGSLVSVAITINNIDYSVVIPVTTLGDASVIGNLAQQPSKWFHARVNNTTNANIADFGPAAVIGTP